MAKESMKAREVKRAKIVAKYASEKEIEKRRDFRKTLTFTIDPTCKRSSKMLWDHFESHLSDELFFFLQV